MPDPPHVGWDLAASSLAPERLGASLSSHPCRRPAWLSRPFKSAVVGSGPTMAVSRASLRFGSFSAQISAGAPTLGPAACSSYGWQMAGQWPQSPMSSAIGGSQQWRCASLLLRITRISSSGANGAHSDLRGNAALKGRCHLATLSIRLAVASSMSPSPLVSVIVW